MRKQIQIIILVLKQQFQQMSFPKLNDFIGQVNHNMQSKRVSLTQSLKNSLARNTIVQSCCKNGKAMTYNIHSSPKIRINQNKEQFAPLFKYEQRLPTSFNFSDDDLRKLLEHLFNKGEYDTNDRNFIRRILLKYFQEDLICAGGREFIKWLKFEMINKNQTKVFQKGSFINQVDQSSGSSSKMFYLVLKGKVLVQTSSYGYKRYSGEHFGQLEILGKQEITSIKAKTDTMILALSQQHFNTYLSKYFLNKYEQLQKKVDLVQPILRLGSDYNRMHLLDALQQRQYKTGDKIVQKGDKITEILLLNHTQISFSEDKILSEFKAVGLNQFVFLENPVAKETIYCMQKKTVYALSLKNLQKFIRKQNIQTWLSQKYPMEKAMSASKLMSSIEEKTISSHQNQYKLQNFVHLKKVRFMGNRRRVLTQPNSSINLGSPKSNNCSLNYPQFTASFVFIKENSLNFPSSTQSSHKNKILYSNQSSKRKDLKQYLLKTRNSFRKKRWLDEIDNITENTFIFNPENNKP